MKTGGMLVLAALGVTVGAIVLSKKAAAAGVGQQADVGDRVFVAKSKLLAGGFVFSSNVEEVVILVTSTSLSTVTGHIVGVLVPEAGGGLVEQPLAGQGVENLPRASIDLIETKDGRTL